MEENKVSAEDLGHILASKKRLTEKTDLAQKAAVEVQKINTDARIAELEHQVVVQHIFLKYGLKMVDRIDDETGAITRVVPEPVMVDPTTKIVVDSASDVSVDAGEVK